MELPLNEISDGHLFQRIVAEYFRSLKEDKLSLYYNSGISVTENGVGGDDGYDILVEFLYEDTITTHKQRWIIECKCHQKAVGLKQINTSNLETLLKTKDAIGYLLICKSDATSSLKRIFTELNYNGNKKYYIWNGTQLWHKYVQSISVLKAFFPDFYDKHYIKNGVKDDFDNLVKEFEQKITK